MILDRPKLWRARWPNVLRLERAMKTQGDEDRCPYGSPDHEADDRCPACDEAASRAGHDA